MHQATFKKVWDPLKAKKPKILKQCLNNSIQICYFLGRKWDGRGNEYFANPAKEKFLLCFFSSSEGEARGEKAEK